MKKRTLVFLIVWVLLLVLPRLTLANATSPASSEKAEWEERRGELIGKLKKSKGKKRLAYLREIASVELSSGNYKDLLRCLEDIDDPEDLTSEDKRDILYFKAECNYKSEKYDLAHQQYLQLKLSLNSTEDPLFPEVQRKLEKVRTKQKFKSYPQRLKDKLGAYSLKDYISKNIIAAFICIMSIILSIILFCYWHRKFLEKAKKPLSPDAKKGLITKKLITLDEMRKQDGRVSSSVVEEIKKELEKTMDSAKRKEYFKNERTKYAALIVSGHKMIEECNKYVPYPITFVSKTPLIKRLPYFWTFTIFGFLFMTIWAYFSYKFKGLFEGMGPPEIVCLFLIATLLIASLNAVRIMSWRTIDSLDEVVTMLEDDKSIDKLGEWIKSLFRSPWQFYLAFVLFLITCCRLITCCHRSNQACLMDFIFITLLIWLITPMIWFIWKSLSTTHNICNIHDLAINPLSPIKTMGLQKWISVIGTYAVTGSIVLTFGCSIPIIKAYLRGEVSPRDFFWLSLFLPLLIFYWLYPYVKVKGLVKSKKMQRMHLLKNKISQAFDDWLTLDNQLLKERFEDSGDQNNVKKIISGRSEMFDELKSQFNQMDKYYEIFRQVDKSPESYVDIYAAVELAKVMGLPSLFAVLSYYFSW